MASTTATGSGSTVNNGGTVVNGGNIDSANPMTNNIGVNELNTGTDYGSKVVDQNGLSNDYAGVTTAKAGSAGGLAYFPTGEERNFLLRGAGDTSAKVNNSASTAVSLPKGAGVVNKIHKVVSARKHGELATRSFNILARPSSAMVPGRTKGNNAGDSYNFVQKNGTSAAVDDATTVPGELTYHFGSLAEPTTDTYKPRDSYEDHTDTSS
jgi:hypothetical protein